MSDLLKLIKSAKMDFVSQNLDIVHLALDKVMLSSRPYLQPYTVTLATGASTVDSDEITNIPDSEIWVLAKVIHRDIEPGIFTVELRIDNHSFFPATLLESVHFLLPLAKAFIARKSFIPRVTNNDTVQKTYRHLRLWHIYDRIAVNKFLNELMPGLRIV